MIKRIRQYSSFIELCGGTHVENTGQIGVFKLLSDISVSSGTSMLEALTGENAEKYFEEKSEILDEIKKRANASNDNVIEKIKTLKKESIISKKRKIQIMLFSINQILLSDQKSRYIMIIYHVHQKI